jgi:hypothetical protein
MKTEVLLKFLKIKLFLTTIKFEINKISTLKKSHRSTTRYPETLTIHEVKKMFKLIKYHFLHSLYTNNHSNIVLESRKKKKLFCEYEYFIKFVTLLLDYAKGIKKKDVRFDVLKVETEKNEEIKMKIFYSTLQKTILISTNYYYFKFNLNRDAKKSTVYSTRLDFNKKSFIIQLCIN